jgi:hypothetical protein
MAEGRHISQVSRREFLLSWTIPRQAIQPVTVEVLEVFDAGNGPSGLLVHQSGPDSREAFSAWLHNSDGLLVRLRTPEGAAYTGRIFRVKMCFGRGLLLVSAVLNIRTKDKVQVEVRN